MSKKPAPAEQLEPAAALDGLTQLQAKFCVYYVGEAAGDGARACEMAGYRGNKNVLYVQSFKNLRLPKIAAAIRQLRASIAAEGIASLDTRVHGYNERRESLLKVLRERGASKDMQEVPGGKTGWLVAEPRWIGGAEGGKEITVYRFDSALFHALQAVDKQAAQDLGQWTEKRELHGPEGGALEILVMEIPPAPELPPVDLEQVTEGD